MSQRTIFIGDVHGCLDELLELLSIVRPNPEDRVILLGDMISKWPNSAGVISHVHSRGYECVLGNHELHYIHKHHLPGKYAKLRSELSEKEHLWLISLPKYIETPEFIAVHGGLPPGIHPNLASAETLSRIRTWNAHTGDIGDESHPPWHGSYTEDRPVFYGHWAVAGLNLRENTFGLDSGCVYGKQLSAYILEEKRLIQVNAKKIYEIPDTL